MFNDLLEQHYETIFPFREPTFSFLKRFLPTGAATVLDIGCGTGAYTAAFSRLGRKVTGIDLSRAMLARAGLHHPGPEYKQLDMYKIKDLKTRFGFIYSTGNVVSFCRPSDRRNFFKAVYESLATGGTWLFQTVNWDRIMLEKTHRFPDIPVPQTEMVFRRAYTGMAATSVTFTTSFVKGESVIQQEKATLYPVRSDAFIQEHRAAGFSLIGHFGGFDGSPFSAHTSGANILVFRR